MRKTMFAAMFALLLLGSESGGARWHTEEQTKTYNEFLIQHEAHDRFAIVKRKADGKVIVPESPNNNNPFEHKGACLDGIGSDTTAIFLWLQAQGVDIENVIVEVYCRPAGQGI